MRFKTKDPLLVLILVLFAVAFSGCQTHLTPGGAYKDDKVLYETDKTIVTTYAALDSFLKWEHDNRATLSKFPEIRKVADEIRDNAPRWMQSAMNLREAYAAAPSQQSRDALYKSLAVLREALREAALHMAKQPPTT